MKNFILLSIMMAVASILNAQTAFQSEIQSLGYDPDATVDLSLQNAIVIDKPSCAYVNITGIEQMPATKTEDSHAWFEAYDGNGNYFKKKIIINAQGKSSMNFPKKNFAVDFCEDDWVGSKTTDITIGDWVTQDAFHFKAFYNNQFRGEAIVGYELYNQIESLHSESEDKAWKRAGVIGGGNARCYPDAFPCIVYLNGDFYGIYAWSLKKHRKNMAQTKDNPNHIHLDGILNDTTLWKGTVMWDHFEIRNPKTLYCINTEDQNGYSYESLSNEDEIASVMQSGNYEICEDKPSDWSNEDIVSLYDSNPPTYLYRQKKDKWYKLTVLSGKAYTKYNGDEPVELIDANMPYFDANNKDMVNTSIVKSAILRLSNYHSELKALEDAGASIEEIKAAFAARFDVTSILDYYCLCTMIGNSDGFSKNWQWFTYDGVKWFVAPYDLDATFGTQPVGHLITDAYYTSAYGMNYKMKVTRGPFYWIQRYFLEDAANVWETVHDAGITTTENISELMNRWRENVGESNYSKEWAKWPDTYCINDLEVSPNWTLQETPSGYYSLPAYNKRTTYNEGDRCVAASRVWIAKTTTTGVTPYVKLGCRDSWERFVSWVDKRIQLENDYWTDLKVMNYDVVVPSRGTTTICVPFEFDIPSGLTLYTINEFDKNSLKILSKTKETSSKAYRPYQIKAAPGIYKIYGVIEKADTEAEDYLKNGVLTGTLSETYVSVGDVIYHPSGANKFYNVNSDQTYKVDAYQAYFKYSIPAMSYNIEVPDCGYTTVCVPFDFEIPSGVQVYTMEEFDDESLKAISKTKVKQGLAHKPYQVKAESGTYTITGSYVTPTDESNALENGFLTGTYEDIQLQEGDIIFPHPSGKIAYYRIKRSDNITLLANHAYIKNTAEYASYTIEVGAKKYTTVCVPFAFDAPSGLQLYKVTSFDPETKATTKEKVTRAEANKPYQVKANEGSYEISGVYVEPDLEAEDALTNGALVGTYEDIYLSTGQWAYPHPRTQSAGYYYVNEDNTIVCYANHAYARPYQEHTLNHAPARETILLFGYGESTGIDEVESADGEVEYYTISGVKTNKPTSGVYIIKTNKEIKKVYK